MSNHSQDVIHTSSALTPAGLSWASRRRWAFAALMMHVLFVLSWLLAVAWQGPRYSVLAHSISDMYAVTAPHAGLLLSVFTLSGVAAILFAAFSLWPSLRRGRWMAATGSLLLALSIFGVGDLLTPLEREACRQADLGCTAVAQLANSGGALDASLSTMGAVFLVASGFFLAAAMQRVSGWRRWVRLARLLSAVCCTRRPVHPGWGSRSSRAGRAGRAAPGRSRSRRNRPARHRRLEATSRCRGANPLGA